VFQLMRMSEDGPLQPTPLWERQDLSPSSLVREFLRECRIVRKGLDGSLIKVIPLSRPRITCMSSPTRWLLIPLSRQGC
jgi:hypothetical protein